MAKSKVSLSNMVLSYGIYIAFVIICIVFAFLNPDFFSLGNIQNILIQASVIGIVAIGQTLVILTGGIDISVGRLMGTAGILIGVFATRGVGIPGLALIGIACGVLVGVVNGYLIGYIRIPAFITTLGTQGICYGISLIISQGMPFSEFPTGFDWMGTAKLGGVSFLLLLTVALYILFWIFSVKTKTGRYIYSIGGNREAVRLSGISTSKYEMIAYVLCGLLAGVGGLLMTSRLNFASPSAGENYEMETIAAVVIGGTMMTGGSGSVLKTSIGAVLLYVLKNGLTINNVSPYYQKLVTGGIIILAVFLDTMKNKKKG
ncbi:ABC transporter permease [Butyricicoccus faecihominis]|uniref:ABC transporter permease n=1 Tax=Butyricicoccaceae TaxID=3085642 RepID=UPI00247985E8|nr:MULTISPECIES: ABC transporter permease [Butyricicoccaceae]MCQ5128631.1 ABC transporter permease [Butyricicoccus faecihominis]WNX85657.1 ABC transporter permease [Agathobaculum sp. NTUH-O15-33]